MVPCDYCNEEANGRAFISDDRRVSIAYCGVHREQALEEVERQKAKRDATEIPNVKKALRDEPNIATVIRDIVVGEDTLPNGKTITHVIESTPGKVLAETVNGGQVYVSNGLGGGEWIDEKKLSDAESERWANRLWGFLEPKVQKLIDKSWDIDENPKTYTAQTNKRQEIKGPGGETVGYATIPDVGPPPDHLFKTPEVDIMDRYGLWSDNNFNAHILKNAGNQSADRRAANEELKRTREIVRHLHKELNYVREENKNMSKMLIPNQIQQE